MEGYVLPTIHSVTPSVYLMGDSSPDDGCSPTAYSTCNPCSPDGRKDQCTPSDNTCYPDCSPCSPCNPDE